MLGAHAVAHAETIAFEPAAPYSTGHVPEPVAIGDLNGDDDLDIVIANTASDAGPGGDNVTVLLNQGKGTFAAGVNFAVGAKRPEGVTLARVNGDTALDIVTANFEGDSVTVLLGDGSGSFGDPIITHVPGGPRFVVAADFDADGRMDLATSNYNGDTVSILKGDGTGNFSITATLDVGNGPEVLVLAQLTPDANVDLVTVDAIGDTVTPLQGDGAGGFTVGPLHTVGENPRFILAQDLNGDGLDDLIVANNDADTIGLERNTGSLTFTNERNLSFSSASLVLREPVYLALADVNGDGDDDILATWAASNVFTVFPQTSGAFNYGVPSAIQTDETPLGIAAADFDRDGDLDIVVSNANSDNVLIYRSYLDDPGEIVNDGDPGTTPNGPWVKSNAPFPFGSKSLFSKNGSSYSWETTLPEAGKYEVMMWWTVTSERSQQIPVEVQHATGSSSLFVDQTKGIGIWHPLGTYDFDGTGKVEIVAPQDSKSVCADAVRFRKLQGTPITPPAGFLKVSALANPPDDLHVDSDTVLAFQGKLSIANANEDEDILAVTFDPIGPGEESSRILECRLYLDSNHDGVYDAQDQQLGHGLTFGSDVRSITFDGFRLTMGDGESADVFVLADLSPPILTRAEPPRTPGGTGAPVLACAAVLAVACLAVSRRRGLVITLPLLVLLVSFVAVAGCGGGGGGHKAASGGGPVPPPAAEDLQLELTRVVSEGNASGIPSVVQGLPVKGFLFK